MTFTHPLYLTLLVSIPFFIVMHFLILKHVHRRAIKFANFEALARVTGMQILNKNIIMLVIRLVALLFLIFSAAGTVIWYTGEVSEYDYILALDTSSSMLANDFNPTRLEASKRAALNFVDEMPPQARVALVTFAGTAYVRQHPTLDRGLMKDAIKDIGSSRVSGTDLGGAIVTSANLMMTSDRPRAVILLTDGQDNVGMSIEEGIAYAVTNKLVVHTIGMGTDEGGTFIRTDLVSQLDEESLDAIADGTGGTFFKVQNQQQIDEAYLTLATTRRQPTSIELRLPLLLLAILILFFEWGLINTKFRTLP